jgi:hypothetical protein
MKLALLLVAGCAGDGILHSETLVRRATCGGRGFAIFGHPEDDATCDVQIFPLGDGCYASNRPGEQLLNPRQINHTPAGMRVWQPHLYQCDAEAAPDGHIVCAEDHLRRRDGVDDDPWRYRYYSRVRVPNVEGYTDTDVGRCRDRYHAWEDAYLPRPDPVTLVALNWYRWGVGFAHASQTITLAEDAIELGRMAPVEQMAWHIEARVCPRADGSGRDITIHGDYPSRFANEMRDLFARGLADVPVDKCTQFQVGYHVEPPP